MNPIYTIMESRHRWAILAGISFLAGTFGAIEMLALVWPHIIIRIWLLAWLAVSIYFLVREFLDWKRRVLSEADVSEKGASSTVIPRADTAPPLHGD